MQLITYNLRQTQSRSHYCVDPIGVYLTSCRAVPFHYDMNSVAPDRAPRLVVSQRDTPLSIAASLAVILLSLFALFDCHMTSDSHEFIRATRTAKIALSLTAGDKDSSKVPTADGGTKQRFHTTMLGYLDRSRNSVLLAVRPIGTLIIAGTNTALAHRKVVSLLI